MRYKASAEATKPDPRGITALTIELVADDIRAALDIAEELVGNSFRVYDIGEMLDQTDTTTDEQPKETSTVSPKRRRFNT